MLPAFCWPSNSWRDQTTASAPLPQILDYGFRSVQSVHAAAPANLKLSNHHYASSSLDAIWHKGEFRQHVHYLLDSLDSQALGPKIMQCPAQDMGSMVLDSAASNYILAPRFVSQRELACHCPILPDAFGAGGTEVGLETPHPASLEKVCMQEAGVERTIKW